MLEYLKNNSYWFDKNTSSWTLFYMYILTYPSRRNLTWALLPIPNSTQILKIRRRRFVVNKNERGVPSVRREMLSNSSIRFSSYLSIILSRSFFDFCFTLRSSFHFLSSPNVIDSVTVQLYRLRNRLNTFRKCRELETLNITRKMSVTLLFARYVVADIKKYTKV